MAEEGRRRGDPDLSRQPMGERIQRTLQRRPAPGTPQRRVVLNRRAGQNRHRNLAETIQPRQAASGPRHASASPRNSAGLGPLQSGWTPLKTKKSCLANFCLGYTVLQSSIQR